MQSVTVIVLLDVFCSRIFNKILAVGTKS